VSVGITIRKLWHHRLGVGISVALALVVSVFSVYRISLSPPSLSPRALEMASAATHVLIDTPQSIAIDLRQDTYSISALTNRAVVLGNVIASTSLEAQIAREAHVPADLVRIEAPLTPQESSIQVDPQKARRATDILKSNDQYRLQINADPEVPILDIYAQTPTAASAAALANAAVDQLKGYVANLAASERTPAADQIRLVQLGRATGVVINPGVQYQVAILAFVLTLLLSCATVMFVARIRAGWRLGPMPEHAADA